MMKKIITNKKAFYDYFLEKKYLAGIQLLGNEVKSIRLGKVNLDNAYVHFKENELFVFNMTVFKYNFCNSFDYEEKRKKKLLLNKKEILQIKNKMQIKGFSIIPTKILIVRNLIKLEIYLAKGKKKYDKRFELKRKDDDLKIKKTLKNYF
ncbi:SsrA-binding protein SmpB [Candidatus Phytoplasma phoenicium]|uniref:SsrA-binding protein n=1 Tax=Candidatus Phytoplasma phoenicium TaxID=198422 RepID=A0A0L0MJK2_9MOLU|nr:SsrA-binding protein SmpB [Candidatus Phytoplasma phoenicium]KND62485.1 SsrA-binding protein [Candidatus Phytoplasma phoenicium]